MPLETVLGMNQRKALSIITLCVLILIAFNWNWFNFMTIGWSDILTARNVAGVFGFLVIYWIYRGYV